MATSHQPRSTQPVIIYTTPHCHWCEVAKRYFAQHAIDYREIDVTKDARGRRDMVLMTGGHAVPVVRVGQHAMVGWNVHEFEKLRSGRFKRR